MRRKTASSIATGWSACAGRGNRSYRAGLSGSLWHKPTRERDWERIRIRERETLPLRRRRAGDSLPISGAHENSIDMVAIDLAVAGGDDLLAKFCCRCCDLNDGLQVRMNILELDDH